MTTLDMTPSPPAFWMEQISPFELIVAVILPPITASSLYVGSTTYTKRLSYTTEDDNDRT